MPIEVSLVPGKGGLQITGQVGEVMQESAQAAMSYLKSRAKQLAVDYERFDKTDTHIHIPEGRHSQRWPQRGHQPGHSAHFGFHSPAAKSTRKWG